MKVDPRDLNSTKGNTKLSRVVSACHMKKQISPAVHWCLTWNNYPEDWMDKILIHSSKISGFIFGEEGLETTPHIQGYIRFKKKVRPLSLFEFGHWEVSRDKKENFHNAIDYCRKEGKYIEQNVWSRPNVLTYDKLYDWQKAIVDIVRGRPDDRTIHWYWEREGNVGKSALCKYLCVNHEALICSGRAADMKFLVANWLKTKGTAPEIIIFDVPRSNLDYISFTGIEELKNGLFASTKYECEMVIMNSPHVLIFANEQPTDKEEIMSVDRWKITEVRKAPKHEVRGCKILDELMRSAVAENGVFDCGQDI